MLVEADDLFLFSNMTDWSVIITAGGIGKRMGAELPKQFLLLANKPILMRTLEKVHTFLPQAQLLITLPEEWKSEWENLCEIYACTIPHQVVSGGKERFHSVKNALQFCQGSKIAIHDGVRPLVSKDTFDRAQLALETNFGAVPCLPIFESLRWKEGSENKAVNRANYTVIQTPQCFHKEQIVKAYGVDFTEFFTDDASVFEAAGFSVALFDGNKENVKITQAEDLEWAEFLWSKQ